MKQILITGGAGYLGLNISLSLLNQTSEIVIVDDMKNSFEEHISALIENFGSRVSFYQGDVCDYEFMKSIFEKHSFDNIIHLAAYKYVGESVENPELYKTNNIESLKTILKLCEDFNVSRLSFASSAVVYGNTGSTPINEDCTLSPLSPYAKTKCDGEKIIKQWHTQTKIPATIFRFSNPAGSNTKFMFGDHSKKGFDNLIPYIVKSAINDNEMTFKGNDHPTRDGTPVRDYIHVTDLADIVTKVLNTSRDLGVEILNVSRGTGFSLLEIVLTTEKLLNKKLKYQFTNRNNNESSVSILDSTKLTQNYSTIHKFGLEEIISSQIEFYKHISSKEFKN